MRACAFATSIAIGSIAPGCDRGPRAGGSTSPGGPAHLELGRAKAVEGAPLPVAALLSAELERNLARLQIEDLEVPAYFLAYDLVGTRQLWLEARDGALMKNHIDRGRTLDVDVRVGAPALDNSHSQNGNYGGNGLGLAMDVAMDDDPLALSQSLWVATELQYHDAVDALSAAESEEVLLTREDDRAHPDFSSEKAIREAHALEDIDLEALARDWSPRVVEASRVLADDPAVQAATAVIEGVVEQRVFVNSEGSMVQESRVRVRLMLQVDGQAEDGMTLERFRSWDVHRPEQLPSVETVEEAARTLRRELLALRAAPLAEPYTGPAVLEGPAAGVFFHEIFGHRLEGHRQKDDLEGQTFTRMLGQQILPRFLDVVDDPTALTLDGTPLNGHYFVDDEAVRARPTVLVEAGKLRTFLLGRSPVLPFVHSNGHGRREPGNQVVARQGNLIVSARRTVREERLRAALIAEAKRQKKPYGLWFRDIQGGYTITDRSGPQAFKVLPLMVFRVWTDGREDELVRGADIVGTPLSAFETIVAAGDRPGVFNGVCGAESGWVPVSAVSPSLLLTKLEIERAMHERDRPPLLPKPGVAASPGVGTPAEARR